ncbi:MAG: transposase [Bdellovibrionales bacterium]
MTSKSAVTAFISDFFPNAIIVADKFHVLRLTNLLINKARIEIIGDKRKKPCAQTVAQK